jgi:hypothetical protein
VNLYVLSYLSNQNPYGKHRLRSRHCDRQDFPFHIRTSAFNMHNISQRQYYTTRHYRNLRHLGAFRALKQCYKSPKINGKPAFSFKYTKFRLISTLV